MPATYLVRFDDICPSMNWTVWGEIESSLIEAGVSPILAVVPDNQDPELVAGPARPKFWDEVRGWQKRGWTIGLHGYRHQYVTGDAGIIGRNRYSEFAGLSYEEQHDKLSRALEIFAREGVRAEIWIAPAHSFDQKTLRALSDLKLTAVSDGYFTLPHTDGEGMFWIPQQLGKFRALPAGVWTVCHHHNNWNAADVRQFRCDLQRYRGRISSVMEVARQYGGRPERWLDRMSAGLMSAARMGRLAVSR